MRKFFAICIYTFTLVLSMAGCGSSSNQPNELVITRTSGPIRDGAPTSSCFRQQWDVTNASQVQKIYQLVLHLPPSGALPQLVTLETVTYVFTSNGSVILRAQENNNSLQIQGKANDFAGIENNPLVVAITAVTPTPVAQKITCS
jgi:hypothetical protein